VLTCELGKDTLSGMDKTATVDWRTLTPEIWGEPEGTTSDSANDVELAPAVSQRDMSPPSDGFARIPCLAGPCKHFLEISQVTGLVKGKTVTIETRRRYRFCRLLNEESGTMTLHEFTFRYCTKYAPPLLSLDGWAWKVKSSHLLMKAALRDHVTPSPALLILHTLFRKGVKMGLLTPPMDHDSLDDAASYDDTDSTQEGDHR